MHWQSCIDPYGDNYEITGLHMGLIVNRVVYRALADILVSLENPAAPHITTTQFHPSPYFKPRNHYAESSVPVMH